MNFVKLIKFVGDVPAKLNVLIDNYTHYKIHFDFYNFNFGLYTSSISDSQHYIKRNRNIAI